ncbi:Pentatricopeptide repeat-containing protein [Porphyridium purpureum]|uniref:Pentatricopeptide repeat-containing protein n=1 Tax=Porphyridium purpureum TaxID=35688 RepID=A0A5J4Z052_PORPP|nr:Pentatricopeptide repeat-containing protein [Porphyridium purpureum]|eukprot:POR7052..scf209_3
MLRDTARAGDVHKTRQHLSLFGLDAAAFEYNLLLHSYRTSKDAAGLVRVLDEMLALHILINNVACTELVRACIESNDLERGLSFFIHFGNALSDEQSQRATQYAAFSGAGLATLAGKQARLRRQTRLRGALNAANMLLSALLDQGQIGQALSLFSVMRRGLFGARPTTRTYNLLMKGFIKRKDRDCVLAYFGGLRASRNQPDVVSFNTLLQAFIACSDKVLPTESYFSLRLWEHARERHPFDHEDALFAALGLMRSRFGLPLNIRTVTLVLRNLTLLIRMGRVKRVQRVKELVRELYLEFFGDQSPHGDKLAWDALLGLLAVMGDPKRTYVELMRMKEGHQIIPDRYSYGPLLEAHAAVGDVAAIRRTVEEMRRLRVNLDASHCESILCAHWYLNQPDDAAQFLCEFNELLAVQKPASINASVLHDRAVQSRLWAHVITICSGPSIDMSLAMWKRALESLPGKAPEPICFFALLSNCGESARPDIALKVIYAMKRTGLSVDPACYAAFMRGLARRAARAVMTTSLISLPSSDVSDREESESEVPRLSQRVSLIQEELQVRSILASRSVDELASEIPVFLRPYHAVLRAECRSVNRDRLPIERIRIRY